MDTLSNAISLGIKNPEGLTKKGSSLLVMIVAGGAICPTFMSWIADTSGMAIGFNALGLFCFYYIFWVKYIQIQAIANSEDQIS